MGVSIFDVRWGGSAPPDPPRRADAAPSMGLNGDLSEIRPIFYENRNFDDFFARKSSF